MQPESAPAMWGRELRIGLFAGVDVVEEATVDELLRDDDFLPIALRQAMAMRAC